MEKKIEHLNEKQAKERGYAPMTTGYNTTELEQEWLRSAIESFRGCDIVIVDATCSKKEIWRHKRELLPLNNQ